MLYARKFDFSNHTLRRSFGRRQWMLGTPIETIADMLGHESVEMTKRYLGLNLEDQDQPMKKQDEFVSSILGYPKKDISEGEPVRVVGPKRFGLLTSRLSAGRSNQAKLWARVNRPNSSFHFKPFHA
jgi:hypothetical protein